VGLSRGLVFKEINAYCISLIPIRGHPSDQFLRLARLAFFFGFYFFFFPPKGLEFSFFFQQSVFSLTGLSLRDPFLDFCPPPSFKIYFLATITFFKHIRPACFSNSFFDVAFELVDLSLVFFPPGQSLKIFCPVWIAPLCFSGYEASLPSGFSTACALAFVAWTLFSFLPHILTPHRLGGGFLGVESLSFGSYAVYRDDGFSCPSQVNVNSNGFPCDFLSAVTRNFFLSLGFPLLLCSSHFTDPIAGDLVIV